MLTRADIVELDEDTLRRDDRREGVRDMLVEEMEGRQIGDCGSTTA